MTRAGTVIVRDGRIVYASEGIAAFTGLRVDQIVGRPFADFIADEHRASIADRYERRRQGELVPQRYEVTVALPSGDRPLVELHVEEDGGELLVHVSDVSGRQARRLRLEAVAALGAALQHERTEDAVHARVRAGLAELGVASAFLEGDACGIRIAWASVPPELDASFLAATGRPIPGLLGSWSGFLREAMSTGAAFSEDLAGDAARSVPVRAAAEIRHALAGAGLTRGVAVRVERRDGGLTLLALAGDWLRPDDVPAVRLFGTQLAASLAAARTIADLSRRNADLSAMNRVAALAGEDAEMSDLFARASEVLRDATGCAGVAVFVLDEAAGELVRVYLDGAPGAVLPRGARVPLGGLLGSALRAREPRVFEVPGEGPGAELADLGFRSLAWLPLVARSKPVGMLAVGFDAGEERARERLDLLTALCAHFAGAIASQALLSDLRRRVEELSLLDEMARAVAASLDLDAVLREGVEAARRLLAGSRGFLALYDPIRSELRFSASAGCDGPFPRSSLPLSEGGLLADVIRERRPVVVEDALEDPRLDAEYRRLFAPRALLAAPLLLRGEPLGVLFVDETRGPRRFADGEVGRVTAVASHLAVAIENARLYAEARGRLSELSTVIDVARVVSSSLDLDEVLAVGADHLKRTLGGSACTVLLEELRPRELRRAASRGEPIGPERISLDAESLAREALHARAPVTRRERGAGGLPEAVLAVPLHARDQPVGVALVGGGSPDRVFTPGELSRATAIASQLAVAVDNARLYSEARRRAEQLGLMHEVGRSLVATLDIRQVLARGVQNIARIVDAPFASLALIDPDRTSLEVRAVAGVHQSHLGMRLPLDPPESSLAALTVHRREPIVVEDGLSDPRVNPKLRGETGARGYLGLPLVVRDRTIGAAVIMDPRGPRLFTPAEVERAAAIANQLAVAVENARLYDDLRRSYADLERAQQQLIRRERLAALGELSAVVAHEVRNPLGVIFNSLGSLRRLVRPTGDAKMLLDIVGEEADRLNRIVGDLLDFARPSTPELRPEQLDRVVEDAVGSALAQNAGAFELACDTDPSLPPVPIDARLVRQAVLNVAVNAVQAMPRGGRIAIRTRREGETALVEIEDSGPGIAGEVRGRIFEPFFTTKASGTGLGLAVVKRIVEGHGGTVAVATGAGGGSVFALRFPLAPPGNVENGPALG